MRDDEQPMVHEIGNRTYIVAPVEPLDLDGVRTIQVGTALWGLALVVLLVLHERVESTGHTWWIWTCAAGFGLGLIGWEHTRRRRRRRRVALGRPVDAAAVRQEQPITGEDDRG